MNTWNQTETLFAFLSWVTSRNEPVTLSSSHEASIAVELIKQFQHHYGLPEVREDWHEQLKPIPSEQQNDKKENV
jgi:hypothetical protein